MTDPDDIPTRYAHPDGYRWIPGDPVPGERREWLPTMPGTLLEFSSAPRRRRPCWKCRLWLRWPPWRRHWGCRKPPTLVYLDDKRPQ